MRAERCSVRRAERTVLRFLNASSSAESKGDSKGGESKSVPVGAPGGAGGEVKLAAGEYILPDQIDAVRKVIILALRLPVVLLLCA